MNKINKLNKLNKLIVGGALMTLVIGVIMSASFAISSVSAKGPAFNPRINKVNHSATSTATTTKNDYYPGVRNLAPHKGKPEASHFRTIQGTVKSASTDSLVLTVRSTDYAVAIASTTRIVNRIWRRISVSDIGAGDKVRVFGKISSTTIAAQIIRDISLPKVAKTKSRGNEESVSTATSTATITGHAPRIREKNGASANWSGYAVETNLTNPQNNAVSNVSGTWTVPAVDCNVTNGINTYSSAWVGIDGYSDNSVEQIGTEQDCINGSPRYYAWYEMYPKPSFMINLPVKAGDIISGKVQYLGNNKFSLTLANATINRSVSLTQKSNALRQSAEWIMEAPWSGGVLPLAKFGTINFSNAEATLNNTPGTISNSVWQNDAITMTNSSGAPKATPSALSSDGSSFNVAWNSSN